MTVEADKTCPTGTATSLLVHGGRRLSGDFHLSGFKHSLVTVVAAACATAVPLYLTNCPDILETAVLAELVHQCGGTATRERDVLTVDMREATSGVLDDATSGLIHGAAYLAPGLLSRFGRARIGLLGGCKIGTSAAGSRPTAHYVHILERFGADAFVTVDGVLECHATRLTSADVDLEFYAGPFSHAAGNMYSGATKMALLCAAAADGISILRNPYGKADVGALVAALRAAGITIDVRANCIVVAPDAGRPALIEHQLSPDLIEMVTWTTAAALTADTTIRIVGGAGTAKACEDLRAEMDLLTALGVRIDAVAGAIEVHRADNIRPVAVSVAHSSSIFSDSQPFIALLCAFSFGTSVIRDSVWPKRFGYVEELNRLGAQMQTGPSWLRIEGGAVPRHAGRQVCGKDLRAAAVLALAGLVIPGRTRVNGTSHLARGYADFAGSLRGAGACIEPIHDVQ